MQLTHTGARDLLLAAQGLDRRTGRRASRADVLGAIRRMGALQIDTIHVVARSPYLVLWSRLGAYDPRWLDELLTAGKIFEYWSHEACFLPSEDFALSRHRMLDAGAHGWHYSEAWVRAHAAEVEQLVRHVRERGAVRSADFARTDGQKGGWWEWKTEKRALEMMFTAGVLMVARRQNFQRVYDLLERVRPDWDDARLPSAEEVRRELALKAVRALGAPRSGWVGDYFRTPKRETKETVERLAREGRLLTVEVEGWREPAYVHPDNRRLVERAAAGRLAPELTTLLSPFDPVVWDRARARALFDFDYRLECYTPGPRRRYGYFTLPVLSRGALVARLDAKAHRAEGIFEVKSIHFEPRVEITDQLIDDLARALRECAAWHETPEVTVRRSSPTKLAAPLRRAVKA